MKYLITSFLIVALAIVLSTQRSFACSTVIAIDVSTSMDETIGDGITKIDLAKEIANRWIEASDMTNSEVAIVSFCGDVVHNPDDPSEPISKFSQNKSDLMYAVDNLLTLCAGTNYNAAFLMAKDGYTKKYSALYYCQSDIAKYKPVILFITDGNHLDKWSKYPGNESGVFDFAKVKLLANQRDATIYVVKIGDEQLTAENLNYIKELATIGKDSDDTTPNYWLDVENADELSDIYGCQEFTDVKDAIVDNYPSVMVYPNPSSDKITVSLKNNLLNLARNYSEQLNFNIYDYMGRKIKSYDFKQITQNYSFDISELKNGSYFIKCSNKFINQMVPFIVFK